MTVPFSALLVKGAGQRHHLAGGPAGHRYTQQGGDLTAQHAGQLATLLLQEERVEAQVHGVRGEEVQEKQQVGEGEEMTPHRTDVLQADGLLLLHNLAKASKHQLAEWERSSELR